MNCHVPLALLLISGCSFSQSDTRETDATQGTAMSQATADNDPTEGEGDTDSGPTPTGADGSDSVTGTETGGSQSASQSGSESGQDTIVEQTSGGGQNTFVEETSGGGQNTFVEETSGSGGTTTTGTTGECMATEGPAPVELGAEDNLGAPGAYVALAKTAITNVPGTAIVGGHVGISPAAESAITGFALTLDPSGTFSTSPAVAAPWRVYAADHAVPTPINLTTAVLAMQAAYTDAAGRVPTDYLNLEGGNLGGLTLAPGIYTWGSTVLIPDDVTLAGCEDDVWIFQIADDLDVSTGKRVLLDGGAQARNVFWQVAGQATIHANAHVEGVILSKTGITFQTGASMNGRALAQTMVALDANAVTAP